MSSRWWSTASTSTAPPPPPSPRSTSTRQESTASSHALEYSDTDEDGRRSSYYNSPSYDGDRDDEHHEHQHPQKQQPQAGTREQQGSNDHHQHHHQHHRSRQLLHHFRRNDSFSSSSPSDSPHLLHHQYHHRHTSSSTRVVQLGDDEGEDEEKALHHKLHHKHFHSTSSKASHSISNNDSNSNWMTQFALSFRSPKAKHHAKTRKVKQEHEVKTSASSYRRKAPARTRSADEKRGAAETTPLLQQQQQQQQHRGGEVSSDDEQKYIVTPKRATSPKRPTARKSSHSSSSAATRKSQTTTQAFASTTEYYYCQDYVAIAAAFLTDYEANRPPSLCANDLSNITAWQLRLHQFKFSKCFTILIWLAVLALFGSSGMEVVSSIIIENDTTTENTTTNTTTESEWFLNNYNYHFNNYNSNQEESIHRRCILLTALNAFALLVFALDLWIRHELRKTPKPTKSTNTLSLSSASATNGGVSVMSTTTSNSPTTGIHPGRSSSIWTRGSSQQEASASYSYRHPSAHGLSTASAAGIVRPSRSQRIVKPLILFGMLLALENTARMVLTDPNKTSLVLLMSVFKPLVLFYVSYQARNALEALGRIIRIVVRVIFMELVLILMFAAVAVRLFHDYSPHFETLSKSWLSLFQLSTTVVNPSLWMPMYQVSHYSAAFFVFFVVVSTFYLHSLVLSVVFQTYIHAASELHERSAADREDAVHLAYLALFMQQQKEELECDKSNHHHNKNHHHHPHHNAVQLSLVRQLLKLLRPHYSPLKINALVEIVGSTSPIYDTGSTIAPVVDYPTFRTKIRQALNASIRTTRSASTVSMSIEFLAIFVAIVNFIYVILVSSDFDQEWFDKRQDVLGSVITIVAGFELLVRFNPLRIADFTPLTRLNATFDGLALVGALVSCTGIAFRFMGYHAGTLDLVLMGRAIDMIRIMRFSRVFRDVVRRSADVFPALSGPFILVFTTLHLFVYLGMALWGGAVHVGQNDDKITPLYDLNNFNSYQEGMVTMFQILVVNDWHAIAEVFLYADRCNSELIVYPFFVCAILIGVSIMLNVLTAFFVESFVTKVSEDSDEILDSTYLARRGDDSGFSIHGDRSKGGARSDAGSSRSPGVDLGNGSDADSEGSSSSDFLEFDVYEREGFDKIMQTVACGTHDHDFAQNSCNLLEIVESLTPGRESVGYMICDQLTLERFGNGRFQNMTKGFLEVNELHVIVTDMHAELLALAARESFSDRSLIRSFPHREDPTKILDISAALIRRHPALSLFVSRINNNPNPKPNN